MQATARAASMRTLCSARNSSLVGSVLRVVQHPKCSTVFQHRQVQGSELASQQWQRASTRLVASQAPQFLLRSGDGVTDSMESNLVELEVKIEGMKCGGCSSRVEEALKAMDHVKGVQVDLDAKLATVEVEADNLIDAMNMLPSFVSTIKELGFEAEPHIEYQL